MADDKSPNTLKMPSQQAALIPEQAASTEERKIEVELTHDVWVEDKTHPDAENGVLRIRTNLPVLDDEGNPKIDKKSKTAIVTLARAMLPVSVAKKFIAEHKANRIDDL